jgi:hypothetical protein
MKQYYGICDVKWNFKQLQRVVIVWWKPNYWRKITFLTMYYTYTYICICEYVYVCVRAYVYAHTKLFISYWTARSKLYSTICVRHFTFSHKITTHEIIFSRKHFYFHPFNSSFWELCSISVREISRTASLLQKGYQPWFFYWMTRIELFGAIYSQEPGVRKATRLSSYTHDRAFCRFD